MSRSEVSEREQEIRKSKADGTYYKSGIHKKPVRKRRFGKYGQLVARRSSKNGAPGQSPLPKAVPIGEADQVNPNGFNKYDGMTRSEFAQAWCDTHQGEIGRRVKKPMMWQKTAVRIAEETSPGSARQVMTYLQGSLGDSEGFRMALLH